MAAGVPGTHALQLITAAYAVTRTVNLSLRLSWRKRSPYGAIVEYMMKRILAVATVASWAILGVLLLTTNPGSVSPAGMLGIFVIGYVSLLGVVTFLLYYGVRGVGALTKISSRRRPHLQLPFRRAYLYASVIAILPMMMMSLRSAGGMSWYEPILVGLFGLVGVVYVAKRL